MGVGMVRVESRGALWRSRWAAVGAALAVTLGAGGLVAVNAASGVPSSTVLTDPVRILDSRDPLNVGLPGPFRSQVSQRLKVTGPIPTTTGTATVLPEGATGVLLNVTAVAPQANGFISIRPGDAAGLPSTSSLNFTAGQIVPNSVQVALPTTGTNAGQIDITYDAFGLPEPVTDIRIDVVGYTLVAPPAPVSGWITKTDNSATITSRASSPAFSIVRVAAGNYRADFGDVDLSSCSWVAVPSVDLALPQAISVATALDASDSTRVLVRTLDATGTLVESGFQVQFTC